MMILSGGDLVLRDRLITNGSLTIDGGRIAAITSSPGAEPAGSTRLDVTDCYVLPGFVDVHVHGVEGIDTLDGPQSVAEIAARLPRYGVTAFCPTSVACSPADLRAMLADVSEARVASVAGRARVLGAHLESNFINPEYRGAQPAACLRLPDLARAEQGEFSAGEILDVISAAAADVAIVTLAPELPGGLELVRRLAAAGHRVSIGHSAATYEQAIEAIEAGASHATHLFNRMTPLRHRAPGIIGAVLARDDVAAELICDGYHVHPALCLMTIRAKGVDRVMAITDGTAGSGLTPGASARLGGRAIRVTTHAAVLEDGTLAGSTLTMDGAVRAIINLFGCSIADAAALCSTTPARQLGLVGLGVIAEGAVADLVVLDRSLHVVRTFINGAEVYRSGTVA
jgi:N-acetylglucosamine-6-phosphate deacetylase